MPLDILLRLGVDVSALIVELRLFLPTIVNLELSRMRTFSLIPYNAEDWVFALHHIGVGYAYAVGDFHTPPETLQDTGVDCSGLVVVVVIEASERALVQVVTDKLDINSTYMLEYSERLLDPSEWRAGDIVCYDHHVAFVVAVVPWPGHDTPRVMVLVASGGTSTTHNDNVTACVQVREARYRSDFKGVRRVFSSLWRYADGRRQK